MVNIKTEIETIIDHYDLWHITYDKKMDMVKDLAMLFDALLIEKCNHPP